MDQQYMREKDKRLGIETHMITLVQTDFWKSVCTSVKKYAMQQIIQSMHTRVIFLVFIVTSVTVIDHHIPVTAMTIQTTIVTMVLVDWVILVTTMSFLIGRQHTNLQQKPQNSNNNKIHATQKGHDS